MLWHRNLVKLLGYCREDKALLLVYEFIPKEVLRVMFLRRNDPFPWDLRIKIVICAARGPCVSTQLTKRECIYRDLQVFHILLDLSYGAVLSRVSGPWLVAMEQQNREVHRGTAKVHRRHIKVMLLLEYIAGHLYVKSVAFAFGVVLLEIMTGLTAHNTKRPRGQAENHLMRTYVMDDKHTQTATPYYTHKRTEIEEQNNEIKGINKVNHNQRVAGTRLQFALRHYTLLLVIEPDPKNQTTHEGSRSKSSNTSKGLMLSHTVLPLNRTVANSSRSSPHHYR
nr:plant-type connexin 32 [Arabidopsis thaliana]